MRVCRVKNNLHRFQAQHRMRPEICKLLVPTIYSDLVNHSSVHLYPSVKGLVKNIFFINHSSPEKAVILFTLIATSKFCEFFFLQHLLGQ